MSKALKEEYIIRIKSRIDQDGQDLQEVELMTRGSFLLRNGSYYITYKETETTGYAGCVTTIKLAADSSRVAMLRYGTARTQLIIEKGRRNLCHYETGYGSMTLGQQRHDQPEHSGTDHLPCKLTARPACGLEQERTMTHERSVSKL